MGGDDVELQPMEQVQKTGAVGTAAVANENPASGGEQVAIVQVSTEPFEHKSIMRSRPKVATGTRGNRNPDSATTLYEAGDNLVPAKEKSQEQQPPQQQPEPGTESKMVPQPKVIREGYRGSGKLEGKAALITGGDSGIGRSVAVHFAREGADVAIIYDQSDDDARDTKQMVEGEGRQCLLIKGDVGDEAFAKTAVEKTVAELGRLDVLVNNAAEQHPKESIEEISESQLRQTFQTNIFGMFFMTKAAMPHLKPGSTIINTASVTAYAGSPGLLDYSSTKGAIVAFTRSLSQKLAKKQIRVNGVAPGPIWTPLIVSTFDAEKVKTFGSDTPLGRAGQPCEVATSYVFLASDDGSYVSGQILHPNGGEIVSG
jgi:NAD(P)-dependent dehydrogenase (short-subunit alcohol dehydrogenase family)